LQEPLALLLIVATCSADQLPGSRVYLLEDSAAEFAEIIARHELIDFRSPGVTSALEPKSLKTS
jgi:hypothetical protein